MDRNGPCKSRGSIILWIRKEKPSGGGVDGSRRLGGRKDGGGEARTVITIISIWTVMDRVRAAGSVILRIGKSHIIGIV